MRVVDSSAWIEWLIKSPTGMALADQIPAPDTCIVPTIVQLELARWLDRERGEEAVDQFIAYTMQCRVVALDTAIARQAADITRRHKLATADAIIYATALRENADILTCDAHFQHLDRVVYIKK
jgi:predicted nucleic acid-binding protein